MSDLARACLVLLVFACGSGSSAPDGRLDAAADAATDGPSPFDAETPTVLPLGTPTVGATVGCPAGAAPGATCRQFSVACPGTPVVNGVVAVASPVTPVGTVVMIYGGGGSQFFDQGFPAGYLGKGLRVVQLQFSPGWLGGGSGIKAAACRTSTMIQWAFDTVHGQSRSAGFCAHGHSGGSGAVSFAVAHYGLETILDYVTVDAGPVFGRIDYGCEPPLAGTGGTTRSVCPEIPAGPFAYGGAGSTIIDPVEGTTTCSLPYGDSSPADQATWARDSVVSPGADYAYPQTELGFWYCGNNPNEASGQGSFFVERVTSAKTVSCVTGQCMVEPAWTDPAGKLAMIDAMGAGCIPRHQ